MFRKVIFRQGQSDNIPPTLTVFIAMPEAFRTHGCTSKIAAIAKRAVGLTHWWKLLVWESLEMSSAALDLPSYPLLMVAGKLKLVLLLHFDLGKCRFCHCGSWFDKDYQKATTTTTTKTQMILEIIQVSNRGQESKLMCEEGTWGKPQ